MQGLKDSGGAVHGDLQLFNQGLNLFNLDFDLTHVNFFVVVRVLLYFLNFHCQRDNFFCILCQLSFIVFYLKSVNK